MQVNLCQKKKLDQVDRNNMVTIDFKCVLILMLCKLPSWAEQTSHWNDFTRGFVQFNFELNALDHSNT